MSNPTGLDAFSSGQIYRKDYPMVLAQNRDLAIIRPVRLNYAVGGYQAGCVLAQYTSGVNNGLFGIYSNGGASGLGTATCVLFENIDDDGATGTVLARGIFGGVVYQAALNNNAGTTGIDSGGTTNLGGHKFSDASGVLLMKF